MASVIRSSDGRALPSHSSRVPVGALKRPTASPLPAPIGSKPRSAAAPAKPVVRSQLRPKAESRVVFLRSLSVMVSSGVPIDRALHHLSLQSEDKAMVQVCDELANMVSRGHTISNAFAAHPQAFTQLQIRLLQVGERTGHMDRVLNELSEHEEKERRTLMKIKGSLTYPLITLVFASLMMIFVTPYIMKGLFGMIQSSGST